MTLRKNTAQYLLTNMFTMFDVLSCYRNSKKIKTICTVRRYKPLKSSTNVWVWPFDDPICNLWGALLIVSGGVLQEQLLPNYKQSGPQDNKGCMKG